MGPDQLTAALQTGSAHHAYDIASVQAILAMNKSDERPRDLPEDVLKRWPQSEARAVDATAYAWLAEDTAGGGMQ